MRRLPPVPTELRYRDRRDAGRRLATALGRLAGEQPIVLALVRGGVPVAAEVARALGAPLDVLVARKAGVPGHPELALGAVAEGGVRALNHDVVADLSLDADAVEQSLRAAERELAERVARYRGERPPATLAGRTALVVDDGLATGATARVAAEAARRRGAAAVALAVPVGAPQAVTALRDVYDAVICPRQPSQLFAVGLWYEDFRQVTDDEIADLLTAAAGAGRDPPDRAIVAIPVGDTALPGELTRPPGARGVVVFAHGSGSSRHSPRNRHVAAALQRAGLATLLFDLLTPAEARDRAAVFDVDLLAARLVAATRWLRARPGMRDVRVGYFGASTGAAAALAAAADLPGEVEAVVARGGRPDLARERLAAVRSPVLLIVGGEDRLVLELNRAAALALGPRARLEVVPGATHLFEEPGALDDVARRAAAFLRVHLAGGAAPPAGPPGDEAPAASPPR